MIKSEASPVAAAALVIRNDIYLCEGCPFHDEADRYTVYLADQRAAMSAEIEADAEASDLARPGDDAEGEPLRPTLQGTEGGPLSDAAKALKRAAGVNVDVDVEAAGAREAGAERAPDLLPACLPNAADVTDNRLRSKGRWKNWVLHLGTRREPFNFGVMGGQFDFVHPPARTPCGAHV